MVSLHVGIPTFLLRLVRATSFNCAVCILFLTHYLQSFSICKGHRNKLYFYFIFYEVAQLFSDCRLLNWAKLCIFLAGRIVKGRVQWEWGSCSWLLWCLPRFVIIPCDFRLCSGQFSNNTISVFITLFLDVSSMSVLRPPTGIPSSRNCHYHAKTFNHVHKKTIVWRSFFLKDCAPSWVFACITFLFIQNLKALVSSVEQFRDLSVLCPAFTLRFIIIVFSTASSRDKRTGLYEFVVSVIRIGMYSHFK